MIRTKSSCALCPLSGRRQIWSEHPDHASLLILGEAPGASEEQLKRPFAGASGQLLNWAIAQVGLYRPALWITNVIACRPPSNDIESLEGQDAVLSCHPGLLEELNAAAAAGVTTILALGATAAQALKIPGKLHDIRGSVYPYRTPQGHQFWVVPTYHPSAIMRQRWKRSGGGSAEAGVLWLADFRKAKSIAENGFTPHEERFIITPTLDEVRTFVDYCCSEKAIVGVDIETTGLARDFSNIVVIGLSRSASDAISIPILDKGGVPYWSEAEWPMVKELVNRLFTTCDQVYQNCFFDVPILRKHGFTVPYDRVVYDTLLIHHTLAPEAKHDLGTIVSLYGSTPFWKSEFRDRNVPILQMDPTELRRYNLRDAVVLHQVLPVMCSELRLLHLDTFWAEEVQPLIAPILEMTEEGIGFSPSRVTAFKHRIEGLMADISQKLYQSMDLPKEFNISSDDHLRWFLFGSEPTSFRHLAELPKKKPGTKIFAELTALQVVKERAQPRYRIPGWNPPKTESGKFAVDKDALLAYRVQLNNRLSTIKSEEERAQIAALLEWLDLYQEYSRLEKLLSTYTNYKPDLDGRIRPRWIAHGTVSGRLASREPNLQNVPKGKDDPTDPSSEIRNFFVARPGWSFVSCDYVNLEAQLLAYETLDPILINIFEQGLNLHDINTENMFHIGPDHPKWKMARKAAKVFFFGGISYGGGDQTIYQKVVLEAPSLNLTFAEFKRAKDSWMAAHPAYTRWKNKVIATVLRERELRTEFGRLRQFLGNDYEIQKEALDFLIQSAGASLVNRAMARIYHRRNEAGLRARFVLQIHDQLVMECPNEEVEQVRAIMVSEMEKPFMYKGVLRKIPVESSVGIEFGAL